MVAVGSCHSSLRLWRLLATAGAVSLFAAPPAAYAIEDADCSKTPTVRWSPTSDRLCEFYITAGSKRRGGLVFTAGCLRRTMFLSFADFQETYHVVCCDIALAIYEEAILVILYSMNTRSSGGVPFALLPDVLPQAFSALPAFYPLALARLTYWLRGLLMERAARWCPVIAGLTVTAIVAHTHRDKKDALHLIKLTVYEQYWLPRVDA